VCACVCARVISAGVLARVFMHIKHDTNII